MKHIAPVLVLSLLIFSASSRAQTVSGSASGAAASAGSAAAGSWAATFGRNPAQYERAIASALGAHVSLTLSLTSSPSALAPILAALEARGVTPALMDGYDEDRRRAAVIAAAAMARESVRARAMRAIEASRASKDEDSFRAAALDVFECATLLGQYLDAKTYDAVVAQFEANRAAGARRVRAKGLASAADVAASLAAGAPVDELDVAAQESRRGLGVLALARAQAAAAKIKDDAEGAAFVRRVGLEMRRVNAKVLKEKGEHHADIEYGKGLVEPVLKAVDARRTELVIDAAASVLLSVPGPTGVVAFRQANVEAVARAVETASTRLLRRVASELSRQARQLENISLAQSGSQLLATIHRTTALIQTRIALIEGLSAPAKPEKEVVRESFPAKVHIELPAPERRPARILPMRLPRPIGLPAFLGLLAAGAVGVAAGLQLMLLATPEVPMYVIGGIAAAAGGLCVALLGVLERFPRISNYVRRGL